MSLTIDNNNTDCTLDVVYSRLRSFQFTTTLIQKPKGVARMLSLWFVIHFVQTRISVVISYDTYVPNTSVIQKWAQFFLFFCVFFFFFGGGFHFLEAPQESYIFCCVIFDVFGGFFCNRLITDSDFFMLSISLHQ